MAFGAALAKADEKWNSGDKKIEPRTCYLCGLIYFRRDQYIIWHMSQDETGSWHYERQIVRICLECSAQGRPRSYLRLVNDAKTSGQRI